MWWEKSKFDKYVSQQDLVAHDVDGKEFTIKLNLKEVAGNGFSRILGRYINEHKACCEDGFVYLRPDYDTCNVKQQNYKKQKLLRYVSQANFLSMLNQSQICISGETLDESENQDSARKRTGRQYYFVVGQDIVKKHQCMPIAALLVECELAYIGDGDALYIALNYLDRLENKSKIQSDLSHFRTLLGESNNLAALIKLVEEYGEIKEDKLFIRENEVKEEELNLEMMSLVDMGLAEYVDRGNDKGYKINVSFSSWLLDYISKTSDRVSFGNLFEG